MNFFGVIFLPGAQTAWQRYLFLLSSNSFPVRLLQTPHNHTIPALLFHALKLAPARGAKKMRLQR